jgi:hypothetical protein
MATLVNHDAGEGLAEVLGEVSQTVTVTAAGKPTDVTLRPFGLRQLAGVLKCVQRMRAAGAIDPQAVKRLKAAENAQEAARSFDMLKMLLDGGEEVINILQIAVGGQLPAHVLDRLNPVDGARLASGVLAVNVDFFYRNQEELQSALAPAVQVIENVMEKGVDALGQPPSTDSSEPDTP